MFAYNCWKNIAFDKYKSLAYHAAPMFALSFVRTFIAVIMFPRDYTARKVYFLTLYGNIKHVPGTWLPARSGDDSSHK